MTRFSEKLVGANVIVVGGTSGIGYGAAAALIDVGAKVTVVSSSAERVDQAVKRLGANSAGAVGDVRDERAFTELLRSLSPVDHIIFSSVDKIIRGPLESLDLDNAKHLFGVKFWGAVVIGKVLKHDIIRNGGSLTLTSGMAAIKPGRGATVGGGLNGGVLSLTKGLATELAEKRIRVNTVVPGLVQTELWDKLGKSADQQKEEFEETAKALPVGFVATPVDIAEAYLFCVRANYATGKLIEIDGGLTL